jgi:hypothetical protein
MITATNREEKRYEDERHRTILLPMAMGMAERQAKRAK